MNHNQSKSGVRPAAAVQWLLALVCLGLAGMAQATGVGDFVVDSSRAAQLENCVEPTEYMRRNHMEVIRHQRDTTVYGGIRSTKHSLSGCVGCHVGYDADHKPVAINDKGQFCAACHNYTAVKLNCFDCHATIPEGEAWNQVMAVDHGELLPGVEEQADAAAAGSRAQ
ncbi:sulfur reduction protein DsrJ [uncultured Thiohalocapsa sp.]|jgi:hypothetical protein|uniref:sulfur reduction protein DsrJ n=1 Tax=uncultured Thiohalocapsa sp. TaxID=768990 RepID=UPI0025CBA47F|nr:sulfur reduction protein DsrJ [uncultured Thiohalocapsa sp.]